MTVESIDQVYDIARVKEQHTTSPLYCPGNTEWTKATISDFDVIDGSFKMYIDLPWNEQHKYGWDVDNLTSSTFAKICDEYGVTLSEFESLIGRDIWLKVRYVDVEDGEIDTGTRLTPATAVHGPMKIVRRAALWIFIIALLMASPAIFMAIV